MISSRKKPPLLPSETLRRVLRVAALDGRILLFVAGFFAILSASNAEVVAAIVGCAAAGAGALELHGIGQIRSGDSRGADWLVRSQLILLAVILFYVAWRITTFDFEPYRSRLLPLMQTPLFQNALEEMHITVDQYLSLLARLFQWGYVVVGVVSIFFQGGLAVYYHNRRRAIERALEIDSA